MKKLLTIILLLSSIVGYGQTYVAGGGIQGQFGSGYVNLKFNFGSKGDVKVYTRTQVDSLIAIASGSGVTAFNGRTGNVISQISDYSAFFEVLTNKTATASSSTSTYPNWKGATDTFLPINNPIVTGILTAPVIKIRNNSTSHKELRFYTDTTLNWDIYVNKEHGDLSISTYLPGVLAPSHSPIVISTKYGTVNVEDTVKALNFIQNGNKVANNNAVVHLTGDEDIYNQKTFHDTFILTNGTDKVVWQSAALNFQGAAKINEISFATTTTPNYVYVGEIVSGVVEMKRMAASSFATTAQLSGYVPYTGASTNVDLGSHTLQATSLSTGNLLSTNVINTGGIYSPTHVVGLNSGNRVIITAPSLTGVRSQTHQDRDGVIALKSDITSDSTFNSITYESLSSKKTTLTNSTTDYPSTSAVYAAIAQQSTQVYYANVTSGNTVTNSALQNVSIIGVSRSGMEYYSTASTSPTGQFYYPDATAGSIKFQDSFTSTGEPVLVKYKATNITISGQTYGIITFNTYADITFPFTNRTIIEVVADEKHGDGKRSLYYAPAGTSTLTELQYLYSYPNIF